MLNHRPVQDRDFQTIATFPKSDEELYFFAPKLTFPAQPKQLADIATQRKACTVVEVDSHLAGYGNIYKWDDGICAIGNVIVAPQYRGQGVARYLIGILTETAQREFSAQQVQISCFNSNAAGLLLYPKLGFSPFDIEQRTGPTGDPVALIHMRLELAEAAKSEAIR